MRWTDSTGETHELPKLTRALAKRIDSAADEPDRDKRWKAQLAIVQDVLGDDAAAVLDGDSLDTVDINALETTFSGIQAAYESPKRDAQAERIESMLETLDIDKLEAIAKAVESLTSTNRQGFKAVR